MKIIICLILTIELLGALPAFALDPSKIYDKLDLNIYRHLNINQESETTSWVEDVVDLAFKTSLSKLKLKPRHTLPQWITPKMYYSLQIDPADFGLPDSIKNIKPYDWNLKGKTRNFKVKK